jgi:hypothetical protein
MDINGYYVPPSTLALAPGTVGAPSLTFSNDATTGIFSPAAGTVTVTAAGSDRFYVNSSGIRVLGDIDMTGGLKQNSVNILRLNGATIGVGTNAGYVGYNYNSSLGYRALANINTSASLNTMVGANAGSAITSAMYNTGVGAWALNAATTGNSNVGVGMSALNAATTGNGNIGVGTLALSGVTTGGNNIGIGGSAGGMITAGSYNIHIGHQGVSGDNATMRLGSPGWQTRTFIAGARGVVTGSPDAVNLVIDSNGQLGTVSSSRRFKTDIRDMGDTTSAIMSLHPVRFRYTAHQAGSPDQYGLVAEEVAEVVPDLVARDKDGQIETVFYDKVNAMLLNEVQKQHRTIESQNEIIRSLGERLAKIEAAQE